MDKIATTTKINIVSKGPHRTLVLASQSIPVGAFDYNIKKSCILCNKTFYKNEFTSKKRWEYKMFCSVQCVGKRSFNDKNELKTKECTRCKNNFSQSTPSQKYCGSISKKQGCSYFAKVHFYRRVQVSNKIRWKVWIRDDFTCKNCKTRAFLSIDHIKPQSLGGKTEIENLQTLCRHCN